jgi:hypothetical protein
MYTAKSEQILTNRDEQSRGSRVTVLHKKQKGRTNYENTRNMEPVS